MAKRNPHPFYKSPRVWFATICVLLVLIAAMFFGRLRQQDILAADPYGFLWRIAILFAAAAFLPLLPFWRTNLARWGIAIAIVLANVVGFTLGLNLAF